MTPPRLLALRVTAWRARVPIRVATALVLGWLVLRAVVAALVPDPSTVAVVVPAHPVEAGAVLSADDLRLVAVAPGTVPDLALGSLDQAVGRAPAVDLPAGLPLVESLLAGERFTLDPAPGSVVVAVDLAAAAGLLSPGDRVDLVGADAWSTASTGEPQLVASSALVVDLGPPETSTVLVAVTPEEGRRIAAIWDGISLGAVLVG